MESVKKKRETKVSLRRRWTRCVPPPTSCTENKHGWRDHLCSQRSCFVAGVPPPKPEGSTLPIPHDVYRPGTISCGSAHFVRWQQVRSPKGKGTVPPLQSNGRRGLHSFCLAQTSVKHDSVLQARGLVIIRLFEAGIGEVGREGGWLGMGGVKKKRETKVSPSHQSGQRGAMEALRKCLWCSPLSPCSPRPCR